MSAPAASKSQSEPAGRQDADSMAETLTAVGWVAKGLLFMVIGVLALELARRGFSGEDADQTGALQQLTEAPLGRVLVAVVGVGLLLYAAWQLWSGIRSDSDDLLGVLKRIGSVGLAAAYTMLGVTGIQIALSGPGSKSGSGGGPTSPDGFTQRVLAYTGGRLVVAAVGIGTIAVGIYHLQKGIKREFLDDIDTDDLDPWQTTALAVVGVAGFAARAMLLGLTGYLFIVASWQFDPNEAAGIDEALRTIAGAPMGRLLLAASAVGLIAAGFYDMVTFRRQRLVEDSD